MLLGVKVWYASALFKINLDYYDWLVPLDKHHQSVFVFSGRFWLLTRGSGWRHIWVENWARGWRWPHRCPRRPSAECGDPWERTPRRASRRPGSKPWKPSATASPLIKYRQENGSGNAMQGPINLIRWNLNSACGRTEQQLQKSGTLIIREKYFKDGNDESLN